MATVTMDIELEELIGMPLIVKRGEEFITAEIEQIRKGLVCISPDANSMEDYWVKEDELVIQDILFRNKSGNRY